MFVGSGIVLYAKHWSCEIHDEPVDHYCDCEFCGWTRPPCCENARWVPVLDAWERPISREMDAADAYMMKFGYGGPRSWPSTLPGVGTVRWEESP